MKEWLAPKSVFDEAIALINAGSLGDAEVHCRRALERYPRDVNMLALLGALQPLALIPAALFFGFLEAGALAMQRQVGVPSSLVSVIEGLTMMFILAAMASAERKAR